MMTHDDPFMTHSDRQSFLWWTESCHNQSRQGLSAHDFKITHDRSLQAMMTHHLTYGFTVKYKENAVYDTL